MTREEELLDRIDEQKRYIKSLETHIESLQEKLSDTQKELEKYTTEDIDSDLPSQDEDVFAMKKAFNNYTATPKKAKQALNDDDWDLADDEKPSKPMCCNMSDDDFTKLLDQLD